MAATGSDGIECERDVSAHMMAENGHANVQSSESSDLDAGTLPFEFLPGFRGKVLHTVPSFARLF